MCTFVILRRPGHDWPVLVAANRDEMLSRPWTSPGRHWSDRPEVVGGRDDFAHGTWMGVNDHGVMAAILNRANSLGPAAGFRSRGEIVLEALDHADAADAARALAELDPKSYRSFNLIVSDNQDAFWLRHLGPDAERVETFPLPDGLSMLTERDLNDRSSARIAAYCSKFEQAAPPDPETGNWEAWARLMASREYDPAVGPVGAMAIVTDKGFGTSSSSLVALPRPGLIDRGIIHPPGRLAKPVWLFAAGLPGDVPYRPLAL